MTLLLITKRAMKDGEYLKAGENLGFDLGEGYDFIITNYGKPISIKEVDA